MPPEANPELQDNENQFVIYWEQLSGLAFYTNHSLPVWLRRECGRRALSKPITREQQERIFFQLVEQAKEHWDDPTITFDNLDIDLYPDMMKGGSLSPDEPDCDYYIIVKRREQRQN